MDTDHLSIHVWSSSRLSKSQGSKQPNPIEVTKMAIAVSCRDKEATRAVLGLREHQFPYPMSGPDIPYTSTQSCTSSIAGVDSSSPCRGFRCGSGDRMGIGCGGNLCLPPCLPDLNCSRVTLSCPEKPPLCPCSAISPPPHCPVVHLPWSDVPVCGQRSSTMLGTNFHAATTCLTACLRPCVCLFHLQ